MWRRTAGIYRYSSAVLASTPLLGKGSKPALPRGDAKCDGSPSQNEKARFADWKMLEIKYFGFPATCRKGSWGRAQSPPFPGEMLSATTAGRQNENRALLPPGKCWKPNIQGFPGACWKSNFGAGKRSLMNADERMPLRRLRRGRRARVALRMDKVPSGTGKGVYEAVRGLKIDLAIFGGFDRRFEASEDASRLTGKARVGLRRAQSPPSPERC